MAELLFQTRQEKLADGSSVMIAKILGAIEGSTAGQFEDKLNGFFNQGIRHLILIMSDIRYINSTGFGLLVKIGDKFHDANGSVRLVDLPEKTATLLKSLGLFTVFKIYKKEEEAIAALGHGGIVRGAAARKASESVPVPQGEKTLVLLKPDAIERGLMGEILARFEKKGLRVVGLKMLKMTEDMAGKHYHEHRDKGFYPGLVQFMTAQPIVALAIEGVGAVTVCRKMTGATFGALAEPGTIRGDFGMSTSYNMIHSSADKEAATRELPIFFKPEEIFSYTRAIDPWIATEEDVKKMAKS